VFVNACGYLAAVYLVGEAARRGDRRMRAYFTRRAQAAGVVTGALSLAALAELHTSNAILFSRHTGRVTWGWGVAQYRYCGQERT
jgi:cytochrome d ubiquinol oxidase subunit II